MECERLWISNYFNFCMWKIFCYLIANCERTGVTVCSKCVDYFATHIQGGLLSSVGALNNSSLLTEWHIIKSSKPLTRNHVPRHSYCDHRKQLHEKLVSEENNLSIFSPKEEFIKRLWICWPDEWLSATENNLCFMDLICYGMYVFP